MNQPHPYDFFETLVWLDGRPLMRTIEPYRREIFERALYSFDKNGIATYDRVLCGRAKKNWKTSDLIFAALYKLLAYNSPSGNDAYILANDEAQAGDDLSLAKKLIACNPILAREVQVKQKAIERVDGRGTMAILPAQDAVGQHGKTYAFVGFDEIHGYRNYDLFEALSPDPTRRDVLTWITSYAGIRHAPGVPLYDFMQIGKSGDDDRMLFSWYGGDFTTDATLAGEGISPETRANPSMASWGDDRYLAQQRRRLPAHKYRRLHLNLPGAPDGAAFSGEDVVGCIVVGRKRLPPDTNNIHYSAFVDMSGGSNDDAVLAVGHSQDKRVIIDCVTSQTGRPPFNPRLAVKKFAEVLKEYRIKRVIGDAFAGETFRRDFEENNLVYQLSDRNTSELYEELEPLLTSREIELPDIGELQEQLLTLVWRGTKITHQPGDHDDWATAVAGCAWICSPRQQPLVISDRDLELARRYVMPTTGRPFWHRGLH